MRRDISWVPDSVYRCFGYRFCRLFAQFDYCESCEPTICAVADAVLRDSWSATVTDTDINVRAWGWVRDRPRFESGLRGAFNVASGGRLTAFHVR